MGLPGQNDNPEVQAYVAEGKRKVLEAGKVLIAETSDAESAQQALAEGALLISTFFNGLVDRAARSYLAELRGQ